MQPFELMQGPFTSLSIPPSRVQSTACRMRAETSCKSFRALHGPPWGPLPGVRAAHMQR
jgi:hypothetical protein